MPPPLTKRKKTGELYVRTASVDAAIDRAAGLDLDAVIREARVDDRGAPGFMEPECLLHLVRSTRLDNSDDRFAQLFEILLDRVARSLKGSIRPSSLYDPEELRQEVADRFVDLLVEDRNQPGDGLDYFEVRFASALAALRIDVLRASGRLAAKEDHVEDMHDQEGQPLPALAKQLRQFFQAEGAEQEKEHFRNELLRAIDRLPDHERVAVTLVLKGHPIEGDDAETIAKLCGVSDRAIRYRLQKAYEKLRRELGEGR
ncbi:RNA polymerase sigma factor [Methylobacterium radiotolerans]|jgi:RNA polymerase sigma factor (sigma-70 family)|uniref:sigma-70 family RNA polymerase sigma factor n=1 Tax=Methylobacterium TaxID=407 RepID=UPI0005E2A52A|nr:MULTISPECIES: sigma-70 family RNA polymerase sigma factor [Methylobacterium]MBN6819201.1 sigma-70 family RNA polymerase sigma factor [Methylobacterium organophilum]OXE40572.1 sigma-70 family RNA polymerase sigma factor [Methylobacterium radiotolerans]GAN49805.1 ECF subfamily RNA polymerase sigma-24 subunit [Methylobacterium sp. ME121]